MKVFVSRVFVSRVFVSRVFVCVLGRDIIVAYGLPWEWDRAVSEVDQPGDPHPLSPPLIPPNLAPNDRTSGTRLIIFCASCA